MFYKVLLLLFVTLASLPAAGVKVMFDPSRPEIGPFPTDFLTAPATNTLTGRRVRMPQPADCTAQPNQCLEAWLQSDFDGFHLQGRVRVRFSGAVNADTLKEGMYLVSLDSPAATVRLNQIVYDPDTNTAYGKPDLPRPQ